jgi:hypothetical protein
MSDYDTSDNNRMLKGRYGSFVKGKPSKRTLINSKLLRALNWGKLGKFGVKLKLNKLFLIIGIIYLLVGGVLISISVTTIVDEKIPASEEYARKFITTEPPLHLNPGETVTARLDITGTSPERDVVFGITTSSNWNRVRVNSSIIKGTYQFEVSRVYIVRKVLANDGGLFTFSWSVNSGNSVLFGAFDANGYTTLMSNISVNNFQNYALASGNLPGGTGYLETFRDGDYFFLLLNPNVSGELVFVEVFMVTGASVSYFESARGKNQANFTFGVTDEDEYVIVVELPDGEYEVNLLGELIRIYPYQAFGFALVLLGAIFVIVGLIIKSKTQTNPNPNTVSTYDSESAGANPSHAS